MPPKAFFRVQLPARQQENVPLHPPTTTRFALPGTLAEQKLHERRTFPNAMRTQVLCHVIIIPLEIYHLTYLF